MNLLEKVKRRVLILDGAIGTEIARRAGQSFSLGEILNIEQPDLIKKIHSDYVEAGADIIETNTFSANPYKLREIGLSDWMLEEIIKRAVSLAREAAGDRALVSGSIGPLGRLLKPLGEMSWDEAYENYYRISHIMAAEGVELIQIETQIDVEEAKIAVMAAKEATKLPVLISMTFTEDGRTVTGTDPFTAFSILEKTEADILSTNCGKEVKEFLEIADVLAKKTKPFAIYPNAGLPIKKGDTIIYPMDPEEFLSFGEEFYKRGASIIGGCCGTTPSHIKLLSHKLKGLPTKKSSGETFFFAASRTKLVPAGTGFPFVKIGERINPFGSKKIRPFIENKNLEEIVRAAVEQEKAGADGIDINLGIRGEKEPEFFKSAVTEISTRVNIPIFIDVKNPESIEAALKATSGRAVINSCSAEEERMEEVLPLAKKYSASVIAIAIDDRGVAEDVKTKLQVLENFLKKAESYDLSQDNFIFDPVVLSVSTGSEGVKNTLLAIEEVKRNFNLPVILGLSNVSYGMPKRKWLNQSFLAMAICRGADAGILRVENEKLMATLYSSEFIYGRSKRFMEIFTKKTEIPVVKSSKPETQEDALKKAIIEGRKEEAYKITVSLLNKMEPMEIMNQILIPAMKEVGELYEKKIYFLPQLIASADAMKRASALIEERLKKEDIPKKWKIVLATVKGDLHDIGKNIVKAVFSNFGFKVIDLGKNVPLEKIIEAIERDRPHVVGLSCLMTTTLDEMKKAVKKIKEKYPELIVIIGGATVSQRLAKEFGADAFGKDAVDALKKIKSLLEEK